MKFPWLKKLRRVPIVAAAITPLLPGVLKSEGNLAKGELDKFNFVESCKNEIPIGKQVVGQKEIEGKYYDCIWVQAGGDWFKRIGMWPQSPWSCQ